jgi:hypothetical protein
MHDRSRAPATALCNGMSESTLASAAAATKDLGQAGSIKVRTFEAFRKVWIKT